MALETWLAFTAAAAVLLAIPGPTVLLVISYALGHGRRVGLSTVVGVALGDLTAMTASVLGLGALLATSAALFTVLKWAGAAYLVYLGLNLWRAPVGDLGAAAPAPAVAGTGRVILHSYAVTALNPKSIFFFVAFLPQFLDGAVPLAPQQIAMVATFVTMATLNAALYALMASAARQGIRHPGVQRAINRTGGSLLIGAGLATVLWRRTA